MKAMVMSDLQVARKYLLQQLVVAFLVGGIVSAFMENIYVVVSMLAVLIPFSLAFTIIAYDERGDWEQFRLALPLSRADVIAGRYASLVLLAAIGVATGLVLAGIVFVAAQAAPDVPMLVNLMTDFSWQGILLSSVMGFCIILFMLAITLPLVSRFGMTKAVRYLPMGIVLVALFLFAGGSNLEAPAFLLDIVVWVQTPAGTVAAAAVALAAFAAVYLLSAALSVKLYAKREL